MYAKGDKNASQKANEMAADSGLDDIHIPYPISHIPYPTSYIPLPITIPNQIGNVRPIPASPQHLVDSRNLNISWDRERDECEFD